MKEPVTMTQIAERVRVSQSTVSLALRDDSRIKPETRELVKKAAEEMGYRRDPALSALIAYRTRTRAPRDYGKIAVLHDAEREWPRFGQGLKQTVEGIREQAGRLGYEIELFRVTGDKEENRKLSRLLYYRGIRGVIITSVRMAELFLEWEHFSTIALGEYFSKPQLNRVAPDHEWLFRTTYQELRKLGYKRIGYCNARVSEERKHQIYLGAYLKCLYMDGMAVEKSPPFYYEENEEWSPLPWLERHGFDAVMVMVPHYFLQRLKGSNYRVPKELGVAGFTLPKDGENAHVAGHALDYGRIGEVAVDFLQTALLQGRRGVPEKNEHYNVIIRGAWRPGKTVRKIS